MLGTASSTVKIMKQKHEVHDILPQCLDILASSFFTNIFDYFFQLTTWRPSIIDEITKSDSSL
jgi:hypothetical protein